MVLDHAKARGIAAGIHLTDAAQGWQFIAISSEAGLMLGKAAEVVTTLGLGKGQAAVKY